MIDAMALPLSIQDAMISGTRELDGGLAAMDEEEFRAFYDRTARPLWAYLSRIMNDRQGASDVLQEAYFRFYRAGARHESESHRRNSLFQIATNIARDTARRGRRHEEVPIADEAALPAAPAHEAPDRQAAVRRDLGRALQHLEPAQRELLWLAYAQGASHDEIAATLGLRPVSVRTLLFRARKKLAALLEGGAPRNGASR